jgi:Ca2+-transporting ATPase
MASLQTRPEAGLTTQEVQERRQRFGFNELPTKPRAPAWKRLLLQVNDPQIYLLLGAAGVSSVVALLENGLGIPYESLIILAIVILNAALGFTLPANGVLGTVTLAFRHTLSSWRSCSQVSGPSAPAGRRGGPNDRAELAVRCA